MPPKVTPPKRKPTRPGSRFIARHAIALSCAALFAALAAWAAIELSPVDTWCALKTAVAVAWDPSLPPTPQYMFHTAEYNSTMLWGSYRFVIPAPRRFVGRMVVYI